MHGYKYIRASSQRSLPASPQGFASYFKSQDMARRSKLRLNKNINLYCPFFLKTYKRFLIPGQFRKNMLEKVFLKKSCCWQESTYNIIYCPPYIGFRAGNLERGRDYQHEIAKMSDQQGQVKRKQLSLDFLCRDKQKRTFEKMSEKISNTSRV